MRGILSIGQEATTDFQNERVVIAGNWGSSWRVIANN